MSRIAKLRLRFLAAYLVGVAIVFSAGEVATDVNVADPFSIVLFVLGVMLSQIAASLARKKEELTPYIDEKPTTLATRGSYCDFVIGRRRVGPIFCWAGERRYTWEDSQQVWWESGVHVLCVGPVTAIHQILSEGKLVYDFGPGGLRALNPATLTRTPPVTLTGADGSQFTVYFGWDDQPIDADLPAWLDPEGVGIMSRHPDICWVKWHDKRLGYGAFWPLIDYEVSRYPETPYIPADFLSGSPAYIKSNLEINWSAQGWTVVSTTDWVSGSPPTRATVVVSGDCTEHAVAWSVIFLSLNANPGDYIVSTSSYHAGNDETTIYLEYSEEETGFDDQGNVWFYFRHDDGANPGHALASLFFSPKPWGAGRSQADYDLDSFEAVGALAISEHVPVNVRVHNGETVLTAIGLIMQDLGLMLAHVPETGLQTFVEIREPVTVKSVPEEVVVDPVPEITTVHETKPESSMAFTFADRERNYRNFPLYIDDDGSASQEGIERSDATKIATVTSFRVAVIVAERRALEQEVQVGAAVRFNMNRGARDLYAGLPMTVDGIDFRMRVDSVKPTPMSGKVVVEAVRDYYGAPASSFSPPPPSLPSGGGDGDDVRGGDGLFWESPILGGKTGVGPAAPRGRSNELSAEILVFAFRESVLASQFIAWISEDGGDVEPVLSSHHFSVAGTIDSAWDAEEPDDVLIDTPGPVLTVSGPDVMDLPILTSDASRWRAGELCVLVGDELCFASRIVALSATTVRLYGLLRGRWGTEIAAHSMNVGVTLFDSTTVPVAYVEPGAAVEMQIQYASGRGAMALDDAPIVSDTVDGRSITPRAVENLNTENGDLAYSEHDGLMLTWNYTSPLAPLTGAGEIPAGDAIGQSPPWGTFLVELIFSGATYLVKEVEQPSCYVSPNEIEDAFGSLLPSFVVRVRNIYSNLSSDSELVTVKKV